MQKNRKLTILISTLIVLFIFIVIAIIYQYVQLNNLTQQLNKNKENLAIYEAKINETQNKIDEVQTNAYIEKWARSELGWTKENETKIEY